MKKILEINPLECPKCSADMRIIAFIDNSIEISKIIKSLNILPQTHPSPIPKARPYDELFQVEPIPN